MTEPGVCAAGARPPLLMGILNVTPDSFSDGGQHNAQEAALSRGLAMLDEGADWVDVGGESTRPGAAPVDAAEEQARVVPVIAALARARPEATISVDTSKAVVARAAIDAGARIVNDVTALSDSQMAGLVSRTAVTCVLMHMRGTPRDMQRATVYADLVGEVIAVLGERAAVALQAGIAPTRILLDPGIGFGKTLRDNPVLIAATSQIAALGYPILVGASRKAFIGKLTGVHTAGERVAGSVGAALAAAAAGASVLRVHDVAATRHALTVFDACGGLP